MTEAVLLYGREEEVTPPTPELMLLAVRETDMLSYRERRKITSGGRSTGTSGTTASRSGCPRPRKG